MSFPYDTYYSTHTVDYLPPLNASLSKKRTKAWKRAVMDSFETIAEQQFFENLQFVDYYRMCDGKLSFQELSEVVPHLEGIQDLLDGVGVPTFLRHYDILGMIVNALVGQFLTFRDKFHVTDSGEVAKNDFLRQRDSEIQEIFERVIQNVIDMAMVERGINPKTEKRFETPEEQQQYMQELQKIQEEAAPKDTIRDSKVPFKTIGVKWGEATLEQDKIRFNHNKLEKEEFRHYLLSGRCFRHFRIGFDEYEPETWDSKSVFTSKEISNNLVQDGEYVGRLHFFIPSEIIRRWGHLLTAKQQDAILGGHRKWRGETYDGYATGSLSQAVNNNFNKVTQVPFANYHSYNFSLALQDDLDIPMGVQTVFNPDGTTSQRDRYLPRLQGDYYGRYTGYAQILQDDGYTPRRDLCKTTEVYFRAYDKLGYLTYLDENGLPVTEEVTEDILPEFLKEHKIKKSLNQTIVDIVKDFTPGTLQWIYEPVIYYGIKIQSENLKEPIYLKVEPYEHQICGDSRFDKKLPVAGWLGKSVAAKIEPYQAKYNLCMNQIHNLLEKELGMFFLMSTEIIPSEYEEWGDAEEALIEVRNLAKTVGIMPIAPTNDGTGPRGPHGNIATYNLSNADQIQTRIRIAEFNMSKAFQTIGIKPAMTEQPNKYETAEGVRLGQESSFAQVADIYEDYNIYLQGANEMHLSVAQYCQSSRKDNSLYYTKSDGSIAFLEVNDPNFPLRRMGIIPAQSSSKRKEMETFRSYILSNNTLGTDMIEVAKLISSSDMSQMIEITQESGLRRQQENQQRIESERANIERKSQLDEEAAQRAFERDMKKIDLEGKYKVKVSEVNAKGRAADKQADPESFREIEESAKSLLDTEKFMHKQSMDMENFRLKERESEENRKILSDKMKMDAMKLKEKIEDRKSRERIAIINKN